MNGFRLTQNLQIKGKLMLIAMATSIIGLLLAGISFIVYERYSVKKNMIQDMTALGMLIADRSSAALVFDDHRLAEENLSALRVKSAVVAACIYNENGSLFAEYKTDSSKAITFPFNNASFIDMTQDFRCQYILLI